MVSSSPHCCCMYIDVTNLNTHRIPKYVPCRWFRPLVRLSNNRPASNGSVVSASIPCLSPRMLLRLLGGRRRFGARRFCHWLPLLLEKCLRNGAAEEYHIFTRHIHSGTPHTCWLTNCIHILANTKYIYLYDKLHLFTLCWMYSHVTDVYTCFKWINVDLLSAFLHGVYCIYH